MDLLQRRSRASRRASGVIGLGYVGLPLAVEFARAGFSVVGYDVDQSKVDELMRRPQLHPRRAVRSSSPRSSRRAPSVATTDQRELADVDVIDICVPTPLRKTRDPDLSYVVKAIEATAAVLRKGQLVILESTTYPGTTDEVAQPALEAEGLEGGRRISTWRSRPSASTRATRRTDQEHPEGRRRHRRDEHRAGGGALRPGRSTRSSR